jgi:glycosyltransferase involved in cell wall biosynthesis
VYDETFKGSEFTSTFTLINNLCKKYPDSIVVAGKKNMTSNPQYRIYEVLNKKTYNMSFINAMIFNIKYTILSYKLLKKHKFDIIHHVRPFALGSTFNLIPLLRINKTTPFIIGPFCATYDSQTKFNLFNPKWYLKLVHMCSFLIPKYLSIATIKCADVVIVNDNFTRKQILKYTPEDKIKVIPPGKEGHIFKSRRRNYKTNIKLLSVGYLIKRKGFDLLIQAFSHATKKFPNLTLTIVGNGPEKSSLEHLVQELRLEKKVIFKQNIPYSKIWKEYYDADIFVIMQRQESFGQVFIEAMASGLPIVTSKTVGSEQIIKNNFGIIVDQNDIYNFSDRLCHLLKNPKKLMLMSKEARTFFEYNYDWEKVIIPKYIRLYQEVLNENA